MPGSASAAARRSGACPWPWCQTPPHPRRSGRAGSAPASRSTGHSCPAARWPKWPRAFARRKSMFFFCARGPDRHRVTWFQGGLGTGTRVTWSRRGGVGRGPADRPHARRRPSTWVCAGAEDSEFPLSLASLPRSYVYTAADVATVLERKRATGKAARNAVLERARLERQRDAAAEVGDAARVEQCVFFGSLWLCASLICMPFPPPWTGLGGGVRRGVSLPVSRGAGRGGVLPAALATAGATPRPHPTLVRPAPQDQRRAGGTAAGGGGQIRAATAGGGHGRHQSQEP